MTNALTIERAATATRWAAARHAADGRRWQIVLNHTNDSVLLTGPSHDLLTGGLLAQLPPGGCAVLRAS
jgi:beta-galactosidase